MRLIYEVCKEIPRVRQLKKLLAKGAAIDYQSIENGYTALMFAVINQHDRITEYLLRQGANPLIKSHKHKVASELISQHSSVYPILKDYELLFAARINDLIAVKSIIKDGALVNFQGFGGNTPIMIAAKHNFIDLVEYLFLQGADLTLENAEGQSIFDLATDSTLISFLHSVKDCSLELPPQTQLNIEKRAHRFFTSTIHSFTSIREKMLCFGKDIE